MHEVESFHKPRFAAVTVAPGAMLERSNWTRARHTSVSSAPIQSGVAVSVQEPQVVMKLPVWLAGCSVIVGSIRTGKARIGSCSQSTSTDSTTEKVAPVRFTSSFAFAVPSLPAASTARGAASTNSGPCRRGVMNAHEPFGNCRGESGTSCGSRVKRYSVGTVALARVSVSSRPSARTA